MGNKESRSTRELFPGEFQPQGVICDEYQETQEVISRKPRLQAINRNQMLLKPVDVNELVSEDHEVRAIWELVGQLDLSPYYDDIEAVNGTAGRPAIDPQLLISIWIYSYSKGISSAREISRLCDYDPAYQWLTGMEKINYHTLSSFRVAHGEALQGLFVEVLGVLSSEGLITLERVMHDGTKVKAFAKADGFRSEGSIRTHLDAARKQVQLMEENADTEVSSRIAKARERVVREKKERLEQALLELEKIRKHKKSQKEKAAARVSMSDPEARNMKQSDGGYAPSYNVQISTDAENFMIVGVDVSQSVNDLKELIPAVTRVKENMGRDPSKVVVDGGFISNENILEMEKKKVDLFGPVVKRKSQSAGVLKGLGVDKEFFPDEFRYDEESDIYICPADKILTCQSKRILKGRTEYLYLARFHDCQTCPFKQKCCPKNKKTGRSITRSVDDPVITAFKAKMKTKEAKTIYKQRGSIAEFPNAWLKDKIKLRQFSLQGLPKVRIEALWASLTYNIKQWIRLCWRSQQVTCTN